MSGNLPSQGSEYNDFTPAQPPSTADRTCDRCRKTWSWDTPFSYEAGPVGQPSRECCPICTEHYREKRRRKHANTGGFGDPGRINDFTVVASGQATASSSPRPTSSLNRHYGAQAGGSSQVSVNRQSLIHANAAAQRGVPVMPTSRYGLTSTERIMGPPSMVPQRQVTSQLMAPQAAAAVGYTANHASYAMHKAKIVGLTGAYTQLVVVKFQMHTMKAHGRTGTTYIGNMEQSREISPYISLRQLWSTAMDTLKGRWEDFVGKGSSIPFPDPTTLTMIRSLDQILMYDPRHEDEYQEALDQPAIYHCYLQPQADKKPPKFIGSKKVLIILLLSSQAWDTITVKMVEEAAAIDAAVLTHDESLEHGDSNGDTDPSSDELPLSLPKSNSHKRNISDSAAQGRDKPKASRLRSKTQTHSAIRELSPSPPPPSRVVRSALAASPSEPQVIVRSTIMSSQAVARDGCSTPTPTPSQPSTIRSMDHAKWKPRAHYDSSDSPSTTQGILPSMKSQPIPDPSRVHLHPSPVARTFSGRDSLQKTLEVQDQLRNQSSIMLRQLILDVQVYAVPVVNLDTIQSTRPMAINLLDTQNRFLAKLSVNSGELLTGTQEGSFKTCHHAFFIDPPRTVSALGPSIVTSEAIVAKRCFRMERRTTPASGPVPSSSVSPAIPELRRIRFKPLDELTRMLDEANCIYWGSALMTLVYDFVARFNMEHPDPPFAGSRPWIPPLRFVYCGVAVPFAEGKGPVYLLEERITGSFIKYILNNSLCPMARLKEQDMKIAQFLCFAQHVQYLSTSERMFLSDFQGAEGLLTDPQVITTLEFASKFGAGNLSEMLENFKSRHQCNHYCTWFKLTPYNAGGGTVNFSPAMSTTTSDMDLGTQAG